MAFPSIGKSLEPIPVNSRLRAPGMDGVEKRLHFRRHHYMTFEDGIRGHRYHLRVLCSFITRSFQMCLHRGHRSNTGYRNGENILRYIYISKSLIIRSRLVRCAVRTLALVSENVSEPLLAPVDQRHTIVCFLKMEMIYTSSANARGTPCECSKPVD